MVLLLLLVKTFRFLFRGLVSRVERAPSFVGGVTQVLKFQQTCTGSVRDFGADFDWVWCGFGGANRTGIF